MIVERIFHKGEIQEELSAVSISEFFQNLVDKVEQYYGVREYNAI